MSAIIGAINRAVNRVYWSNTCWTVDATESLRNSRPHSFVSGVETVDELQKERPTELSEGRSLTAHPQPPLSKRT